MDITWLGNSAFLIKTSLGKRIVLDPLNKFHSCNIKDITPNIITFSDYTEDLICLTNLNHSVQIIKTADTFETELGTITGINTFSDDCSGAKRGPNIIYILEIDGLKLCHLGYLGCTLSPEILAQLKNLDILFIPVGGNVNLNSTAAYKLCKHLSPKIIIPMNYKVNSTSFLFKDIQDFILLMKDAYKIENNSLTVSKESITDYKEKVIILPYNCSCNDKNL